MQSGNFTIAVTNVNDLPVTLIDNNAAANTVAENAANGTVVGTITVSAGVATMRGAEDNGAAMLRRGDAALYEAKGQGRNRVCMEA